MKKLKKVFKNNFNIVYHFAAQAGVRYSLINQDLTLIAIYWLFLI